MAATKTIRIDVLDQGREVFSAPLIDQIEIGRQRVNELDPYQINRAVNPPRLIIAPLTELEVSRSHALLETRDKQLTLKNISSQAKIEIPALSPAEPPTTLNPGDSLELCLPLTFSIGQRVVRVHSPPAKLVGLEQMTMPPSMVGPAPGLTMAAPSIIQLRDQNQMDPPELMNWLRNILTLFQGTPNTDEFFQQATAAMAQMLELDLAAVLFRENESWKVRSLHQQDGRTDQADWEPSLTILNEVHASVRAHRQIPDFETQQPESLMGVKSLVAAPILSPEGEVIGAMYGDKRMAGRGPARDISEVETMFVELLASGIAAGLARLQQEKEAVKARVRFEQFFPANLVEKLENDQEFLKGRESEVTVLFCDIRKFSEIAERVGPEVTVQFINHVMGELSYCVQANQGVLVDYIGDELIAMWGAPDSQPDHATMATRAARDMLAKVKELGDQWDRTIGQAFQIGIGLNSGVAQVGNIGSKLRFKYGPLGNTVNVASRVQGVTKVLRVPLLVTLETAQDLDPSIAYRKIGQVKLINVSQPVTVCEVPGTENPDWVRLKTAYEEGLERFEAESYLEACNALSAILQEFPDDTPTMNLLSRAVEQLSGTEQAGDPRVWVLDSK
ncbi:MAG: diguanylate cyclase [Mariniblastus sp.]|nr:diguanylate cyclase [Mariniblastus sp.]